MGEFPGKSHMESHCSFQGLIFHVAGLVELVPIVYYSCCRGCGCVVDALCAAMRHSLHPTFLYIVGLLLSFGAPCLVGLWFVGCFFIQCSCFSARVFLVPCSAIRGILFGTASYLRFAGVSGMREIP